MARPKKIGNENFKNLLLDITKYHFKIVYIKEEVTGLIKLIKDYPSSLSDIGKKYGYSREYIRQIIRNYDLPNPYQLARKRVGIEELKQILQELNPAGTKNFAKELKSRLKKIQKGKIKIYEN